MWRTTIMTRPQTNDCDNRLLVEHKFKVITDETTLYFISKSAAKATRDRFKDCGVKAWIMLRVGNSYIPLIED